ncbi:hemolysin expression modulating protein [Cucumis melo var. makuwa]|uniref:Hemolysin expression modulating protein n=1 Tax=Cucumis melo var. makuwa TaxID=1194695 RepID=A0A5D3BML3_CUCMM|nr:hemolysin expression modulating protein [Cucumis melo var. makuwa]
MLSKPIHSQLKIENPVRFKKSKVFLVPKGIKQEVLTALRGSSHVLQLRGSSSSSSYMCCDREDLHLHLLTYVNSREGRYLKYVAVKKSRGLSSSSSHTCCSREDHHLHLLTFVVIERIIIYIFSHVCRWSLSQMQQRRRSSSSMQHGVGDHHLKCGTGNHHLECGAYDHHLQCGACNHHLQCGACNHHLQCGACNHHLQCGAKDHHLQCGAGNHHLKCSTGDHHLQCGAGDHHLQCSEAETIVIFIFNAA